MVKELIRFIYVIAGNLHRAWMIPLMGYYSRHPEKYSERFRYEYNKHAIRLMNHTGRIYTQAYGAENLPKDGGYVMFANHQGKYDALGIMLTHEEPCSVVMDEARSKMPLVKQFIDMVGGYSHRNGNHVDAFKAGSFKSAMRAKAPIVPVALVDSWKVFDLWSLRKVNTQVYYLKPIPYEEYRDMKSVEVAKLVYDRITAAIAYAEKYHPEIAVIQ